MSASEVVGDGGFGVGVGVGIRVSGFGDEEIRLAGIKIGRRRRKGVVS